MAREIGVLYDKPLCVPDPRPSTSGEPVETMAAVDVEEPDLCPRFTARVVTGVKVVESPWWMRKRLETIGVRPISNLVDVTNYVMFECGQPLHAYDLDRLVGRRLVVRRARPGEKLTAINNRVYDLTPDMLTIADASRPVGLAGVMGGLDTEIGPGTSNVLIEAAQFDPISVRRTSRALGLFSPSSFRFERPLDPEGTEWASRRCAELVLKVAGGTLHPGVIDVGRRTVERPTITATAGSDRPDPWDRDRRRDLVADPPGAGPGADRRGRRDLDVPPAELAERPGPRDRPDRGSRRGSTATTTSRRIGPSRCRAPRAVIASASEGAIRTR